MSDEDETGAQLAGKARMMEEDEEESRKLGTWKSRDDEGRGGTPTQDVTNNQGDARDRGI